MRTQPTWLLVCFVMAGCGGRSALGWRPQGIGDGGAPADYRLPYKDSFWPGDFAVMPDRTRPRDMRRADIYRPPDASCLPVDGKEILGTYTGSFSGKWNCPGLPGGNINAMVSMSIGPGASPANFSAKGTVKGSVSPQIPFNGNLTGALNCTVFSATLTNIVVGTYPLWIQATGSMTAKYAVLWPGKWGLTGGMWAAKQVDGSCSASGQWTAQTYP